MKIPICAWKRLEKGHEKIAEEEQRDAPSRVYISGAACPFYLWFSVPASDKNRYRRFAAPNTVCSFFDPAVPAIFEDDLRRQRLVEAPSSVRKRRF